MKPEKVNPKNFKVENIVYDNNYFSIAYGIWESGERHLVMRWNGETENDPGYPKLFKNPVWFLISEELKVPILTSLIKLPNSRNFEILEVLKKEME